MEQPEELDFRPIVIYTFDTEIVTMFLDKIVPLVKSEFFFHRQITGFAFNAN